MTDPNFDRLLAKRYRIQKLIGTGAMSRVYLANDVYLDHSPVAVKFLTLSVQNHKMRLRQRFEQEAKICALLSQKSPQIIQVKDYGLDENDTPYYVMEYLQGKSLSYIIRQQPLSLARFLHLARQICLGLQCAHQGILIEDKVCPIIHRDIKPSNIIVSQDDTAREVLKILDFGIAKLVQADSDQTSYYLGTLAYSSPEQMDGKELDQRSDIYSLGVMMFEMLSGKLPLQCEPQSFAGWYKTHHLQTPQSFKAVDSRLNLPPALEDLVMSCMAKQPSARPQTIDQILQNLMLLQQQYSVSEAELSTALDVSDLLVSWPQTKPIADIVFSQPISTNKELIAALWVMLPQQEIEKRLLTQRYNQFLYIALPHPMILWITVLHSQEYGTKWLPCYLDMKAPQSQEVVMMLGEKGYYRLLLFAREAPKRPCAYILLNIAPAQCQSLKHWFISSQNIVSTGESQASKVLLKQEFEELKPRIIRKLDSIIANGN